MSKNLYNENDFNFNCLKDKKLSSISMENNVLKINTIGEQYLLFPNIDPICFKVIGNINNFEKDFLFPKMEVKHEIIKDNLLVLNILIHRFTIKIPNNKIIFEYTFDTHHTVELMLFTKKFLYTESEKNGDNVFLEIKNNDKESTIKFKYNIVEEYEEYQDDWSYKKFHYRNNECISLMLDSSNKMLTDIKDYINDYSNENGFSIYLHKDNSDEDIYFYIDKKLNENVTNIKDITASLKFNTKKYRNGHYNIFNISLINLLWILKLRNEKVINK